MINYTLPARLAASQAVSPAMTNPVGLRLILSAATTSLVRASIFESLLVYTKMTYDTLIDAGLGHVKNLQLRRFARYSRTA
jgi:hypothetical protein